MEKEGHFEGLEENNGKGCKRQVKNPYYKSSKKLCQNMKEAELRKLGRYHMLSKMDFMKYMSTLSESEKKEELTRLDLEYARTNQCVYTKLEGILKDFLDTAEYTAYEVFVNTEQERDLMEDAKKEMEKNKRLLKFQVNGIHRWHSTNKMQKKEKRIMKGRLEKMAHLNKLNLEAISMKIEQELNEN